MTDSYGGSQPGSTGATPTGAPTGGAPTGGSGGTLGGPSSTTEAIVESARGTRNDFLYGDDRAIVNPPNWASQSSTQLYHGAVDGNDPGFADAMGQTWSHHGTELGHVADTLYEAITELSGVWVGEASGAAQGALIGVANASSTAGDAARTMGQRMSQQAAAAAEVKKMPPPKEFDYNAEIDKLLTGHPAAMSVTDLKATLDEAQAVRAEQQRYMDEYTRAMSEIDSATPSFGPDSIGMKPVAAGGYTSGPGVGPGGTVNVTGGGASLAGAQGAIDAATAAGARTGAPVAGGAGGSSFAGTLGQQPTSAPLSQGQIAATGASAVSAQASGPNAAGMAAGAALGAGAGLAGARALAKGGRFGKRGQQRPEATEATPQEAQEAQAEATEEQAAGQAPGVPEPAAGQHTGQLPQQPVYQGNWQQPQAPAPYGEPPLAAGATTGAAAPAPEQPVAGQVSASTDDGAAAQPQAGQQHQQQWNAQAAGQGGPVAPMHHGHPPAGGHGAGGGAAGVDAGDAEHEPSSYLIEPDPDDLFGPTDTATAGVIGAEFEDD